jgi:RNA polymerase sigma-70 factor (ECF subfamily)
MQRTNEEWLAALRGSGREAALSDLRQILVRGLSYALVDQPNLQPGDLEDFAQEALLRILDRLDSFRGESQFTTWAHKIAIRVAFTELRRLRWRDVSLDAAVEAGAIDFVPEALVDMRADPEQQVLQRSLLEMLRQMMMTDLTERQRQALAAMLYGMPLEEIARRMGSNRNALYKLLHDARQKLKSRMMDHGLSSEDVMHVFGL